MKILIIKTDRVGDFINISPILRFFMENNDTIEVICSKYNYQVANKYNFIKKFYFYEKSIIFFLLRNYRILKMKYDIILQLDGKNWSYFLSLFISSNNKLALNYKKTKKILGFNYKITRPNFFLKFFFNFLVLSKESYDISDNKEYHYLKLYLKLLELININVINKKHYWHQADLIKKNNNINSSSNYILFHFDKRWKKYIDKGHLECIKKMIVNASKIKLCIITSDKNNYLLSSLKNITCNNIKIVENTNIEDIVSLVKFSELVVSHHTGLIVHLAACFNKRILDIVPRELFNELDRWIPLDAKYTRSDIEDVIHLNMEKFIF